MEKPIKIRYCGAGERIDKFLASHLEQYTRGQIQHSIVNKLMHVNEHDVKSNYRLKYGDNIKGKIKLFKTDALIPEKMKLDIIFENDDVLVINKPAGMVVHPGNGNETGTLANTLIYHYPKIVSATADRGEDKLKNLRPGIVHRLDKDTSGVMIVAKSKKSYEYLIDKFKKKNIVKKYLAVCLDSPKNNYGTIDNVIGRKPNNRKMMGEVGDNAGKKAVTFYKVLRSYEHNYIQFSLIEFEIKTGRTHQIRVHAKESGFPILGDRVYFTKESKAASCKLNIDRQLLHSHTLTLKLPDAQTRQIFTAPMPNDMKSAIEELI
jgi:23S rRNA pseudouridine1911/1915/1917 synthase